MELKGCWKPAYGKCTKEHGCAKGERCPNNAYCVYLLEEEFFYSVYEERAKAKEHALEISTEEIEFE